MTDWVVLLERIEAIEKLLERLIGKPGHFPTNADVKAWRDEASKDTRLRDAEGTVAEPAFPGFRRKSTDEPIEPLPVFIPKIDLLDWVVAIERSAKQRPRAWSVDRVTEALRAKFEL